MQNQYQYCPNCRQIISITDSACKFCGHIIVKANYENKYGTSSTGDEKTSNLQVSAPNVSYTDSSEKTSKKNILPIIGIALAVVALIVLVVLAITKDGKKKETSEDTTEQTEITSEEPSDTTEQVTTEISTEQPTDTTAPSTETVLPEGMSDDWKDMQIYIDGDLYQFPMAYEDFMATGWTVVSGEETMPGINTIKVIVERNGMQCRLVVMNYDVLEAPRETGYVIGIYMDVDSVPVGQHEVMLPGGVVMYQSSAEDIVATYGEASLTIFEDEVTQMEYVNSTYTLIAELLVDNSSNALGSILLYYSQTPDWVTYDMSLVPTSAPDFNSNYVAPSGPSQDRFDSIVSVDGVNYQLPVPLSVFLDNGWTINPAEDDMIPGMDNRDFTIYKGDSEIDVCLHNYTMDAMYPINAMVVGIRTSDYFCDVEVVFPGDIYFESDTGIDFANTYGDLGDMYYFEDDGYSLNYEVNNEQQFVYIYASSLAEEEILDYYYYEFIPQFID